MISYIRGQNSRHMNPFEIERGESFIIGDSDLRELLDRPYKSGYGMILFCYKGTANISVDLSRWDIRRNTVIVLIPDTILTLNASSEDFKVQYISFSKVLFDEAVFRLDPPFFRFINFISASASHARCASSKMATFSMGGRNEDNASSRNL